MNQLIIAVLLYIPADINCIALEIGTIHIGGRPNTNLFQFSIISHHGKLLQQSPFKLV